MRTVNDLRFKRLKLVFEGRQRQLEKVRDMSGWLPNYEERCAYSRAVHKYTKARKAWRAARGWS